MSGTAERVDPQRMALYLRVLGGDFGAVQIWFDQHVLDRYRAQAGWRVMRTNTVGRVKSPEGWSLDFGIAEGAPLVHASAADLSQRGTAAQHFSSKRMAEDMRSSPSRPHLSSLDGMSHQNGNWP